MCKGIVLLKRKIPFFFGMDGIFSFKTEPDF
jgi:hypothetical protein